MDLGFMVATYPGSRTIRRCIPPDLERSSPCPDSQWGQVGVPAGIHPPSGTPRVGSSCVTRGTHLSFQAGIVCQYPGLPGPPMHDHHPKTTIPHASDLSRSVHHARQTATSRQEGLPNRDKHRYPYVKLMQRFATGGPVTRALHGCTGNGQAEAAKWMPSPFQTDPAKNPENTWA